MREKIARVLAKADGMHPEAVSNDEDELPIWTTYLDDVDAVLDALLEPTEGMLSAGNEKMNWGPNGVSEVWGNMIQAARDGK